MNIAIEGCNKDKTTFTSYHKLHRLLQMLFSVKQPCNSSQQAIDAKRPIVKGQFALLHLDNIIIFFRSVDNHLDYLRTAFGSVHDSHPVAKLKKYVSFFEGDVRYS